MTRRSASAHPARPIEPGISQEKGRSTVDRPFSFLAPASTTPERDKRHDRTGRHSWRTRVGASKSPLPAVRHRVGTSNSIAPPPSARRGAQSVAIHRGVASVAAKETFTAPDRGGRHGNVAPAQRRRRLGRQTRPCQCGNGDSRSKTRTRRQSGGATQIRRARHPPRIGRFLASRSTLPARPSVPRSRMALAHSDQSLERGLDA